jgi:hypothetical protein
MISLRWGVKVSNATKISLHRQSKNTFLKHQSEGTCSIFRMIRLYSICSSQNLRIYVIAGEPSGDAIGAKLIQALQREQRKRSLGSITFQGIGG